MIIRGEIFESQKKNYCTNTNHDFNFAMHLILSNDKNEKI